MLGEHSTILTLCAWLSRRLTRIAVLCGVLVLGLIVQSVFADTPTERRNYVQSMSAQEKNELLEKKNRFEQLPPAEQERLRELHRSIEEDSDAQNLKAVLDRYVDWLKTLSAGERADLADLPPAERIAEIRRRNRKSAADRYGRYARVRLKPEDATAVRQWMRDFATSHEEELLQLVSEHTRGHLERISDPKRRLPFLMMKAFHENPEKAPRPDDDDHRELLSRLAEETRTEIEAIPDADERVDKLKKLVEAALFMRGPPRQVDQKELMRFFAEDLDSEMRERLERLPAEKMKRELHHLYQMRRGGRRFGEGRFGGRRHRDNERSHRGDSRGRRSDRPRSDRPGEQPPDPPQRPD